MFDLQPLRSAAFRHLAAAGWVNEVGNTVGEVALAILVYDRTGSPLASSTLFLAMRFLPAVLAPMMTAYAEPLNPRFLLTVIYVLEAFMFAVIAAVARHFSLPVVLALVAVDGVLAILASTLMRSATANDLMAHGLLREGNSVINLGTMIAYAAAPAAAGAIIASHGASKALLIDAGTFLLAALVILTGPGVHIERNPETETSQRIRAGLVVLRQRPALRRLLIAIAFMTAMISIPVPIEVVFAQTTLHAGSSGYGLLLTSWGLGMIAGATFFALDRDIRLMRLLGIGTLLIAIGYSGLGLSPTLAIACAFSAVGGTGNGVAWVAAVTEFQGRIPLTAQSKVMSVFFALSYLMPALGFVIGGVVTTLSSPRVAYAAAAVGTVLAVAVFALFPIDRVRFSPVVEEPIKNKRAARALHLPIARRKNR